MTERWVDTLSAINFNKIKIKKEKNEKAKMALLFGSRQDMI